METKIKSVNPKWKRCLKKLNFVGIDAMCFIYQFEAHHFFGPLTYTLFSCLEGKKLTAVSSVLTLAEILSSAKLQKDRIAWEEEKQRLLQTPNLKLVAVDEKICEGASIMRAKYHLTLPNAIQLVTALFHQTDGFITNDEKFRKIEELPIILLKDYI